MNSYQSLDLFNIRYGDISHMYAKIALPSLSQKLHAISLYFFHNTI